MTKKILVPIDLLDSETTKKVLSSAVELSQVGGGELTVMTVVPDIIAGLDWRYAIRGETGGLRGFRHETDRVGGLGASEPCGGRPGARGHHRWRPSRGVARCTNRS